MVGDEAKHSASLHHTEGKGASSHQTGKTDWLVTRTFNIIEDRGRRVRKKLKKKKKKEKNGGGGGGGVGVGEEAELTG